MIHWDNIKKTVGTVTGTTDETVEDFNITAERENLEMDVRCFNEDNPTDEHAEIMGDIGAIPPFLKNEEDEQ